ncbi:unnamed protein product [Lampetra fluviatilis]
MDNMEVSPKAVVDDFLEALLASLFVLACFGWLLHAVYAAKTRQAERGQAPRVSSLQDTSLTHAAVTSTQALERDDGSMPVRDP